MIPPLAGFGVVLAALGYDFWRSRERSRRLRERMSRLEQRLGTLEKLDAKLERLGSGQARLSKQLVELDGHGAARAEALGTTLGQLQDGQVQLGFVQSLSTTLSRDYPVFFGLAALDAFSARAVLECLEQDRPRVVLELGSGSSTVMIAQFLQKLGMHETRHIAVDHDEYYLEATRLALTQQRLERDTELWLCPLEARAPGEPPWYGGVVERLHDTRVDLVLVDGPPGDLHARAREPALPELHRHLGSRAVVILDDAARKHEQGIVEAWRREFPEMHVRLSRLGKGYAEFRRAPRGRPT